MSVFENLLKIKTWKKSHLLKAVFIPHSLSSWEWTYFIYYYDISTHSFYINDLDKAWIQDRTSAINLIEHIATKIFYQETNAFGEIVKKILRKKLPNFITFYKQKSTGLIILDRVDLETYKKRDWTIVKFLNPKWSDSSKKINCSNLKNY